MSKAGQPAPHSDPQEPLRLFASNCSSSSETLSRITSRVHQLGLSFTPDELYVLAVLDTPARLQEFLNTQIYYNNDHASPDQEETAMSPRQVLQTARAHCFEGAMFAYMVRYIHGHNPRLVLLEASQDSEHNLILYQDEASGNYGANAHSAFPHLDGRPAVYPSVRAQAESYQPWYYSDRTKDPHDLTLVGYSDPFDLSKYGVAWMGSNAPIWDIYYTYIDDTISFHYLFDDRHDTHPYPLIRALKEHWIRFDEHGCPYVNVTGFHPPIRALWDAFWGAFHPSEQKPLGVARDIQKQFMQLTGTTPIDLAENAADLQYFLQAGYRIEQLIPAGI